MCGLFVESTAIDNPPSTSPVVTALIFDHEEAEVHEEVHAR